MYWITVCSSYYVVLAKFNTQIQNYVGQRKPAIACRERDGEATRLYFPFSIFCRANHSVSSLNNSKTKLMIFHNIQKTLKNKEIPMVKINNVLIERLSVFNFLGIQIEENLSWTPHKNCIANKLSRICGIITRLKQYVPLYHCMGG